MRGFNRLIAFAFFLMLCLCLTAPAKAQCNGGVCVGGFNGFAAFGGPVFIPANRGFAVGVPLNGGFSVNSRGFNASGNGNANVNFVERRGPLGRVRFRSFSSN